MNRVTLLIGALLLSCAPWILIIVGLGGWFAIGLAACGLFGMIAIMNCINYGHVYPPDEIKTPWWR